MSNVLNVGNDADFAGLQPQILHMDPVKEPAIADESNNSAFLGGVHEPNKVEDM